MVVPLYVYPEHKSWWEHTHRAGWRHIGYGCGALGKSQGKRPGFRPAPEFAAIIFDRNSQVCFYKQMLTGRVTKARIVGKIKSLVRPVRRALKESSDGFLNDVSGVVHVGANIGDERKLYRAHGLSVIWVEPIPEVFNRLSARIQGFKNQKALQALVTDVDDKEYRFYISNNYGASSSILKLKHHKDVWPNVNHTTSILLKSVTLATLFKREQIDASKYQALIMDVQGAELFVLRGSIPILNNFKFIKTEVSDFESYEGCCQLSDVNDFMIERGYKELSRNKFASRTEGGGYFDIVYKNKPRKVLHRTTILLCSVATGDWIR
jgi:2-O-methyltransferase